MSWAELQKKMAEARKAKNVEGTEKVEVVEDTEKKEVEKEIEDDILGPSSDLDLSKFKKPRSTPRHEIKEDDSEWGFDLEVVPEGQQEEDAMLKEEPPVTFEPTPDPYSLPVDQEEDTQEIPEEVVEEVVEEESAVPGLNEEEDLALEAEESPVTVSVEEDPRPPSNPEYTEEVQEKLLSLLESCLFQVVDSPEDFEVEVVRSANVIIITVLGKDHAMGRLLGKKGRYANAMRDACLSWWGKYNMRSEYSVISLEGSSNGK